MQGHLAVRSHDTIPQNRAYIKRKRRWKAAPESALIWQRCLINILGQHTSHLNHQCSLHHMVTSRRQPANQAKVTCVCTHQMKRTNHSFGWGYRLCLWWGGLTWGCPLFSSAPNSSSKSAATRSCLALCLRVDITKGKALMLIGPDRSVLGMTLTKRFTEHQTHGHTEQTGAARTLWSNTHTQRILQFSRHIYWCRLINIYCTPTASLVVNVQFVHLDIFWNIDQIIHTGFYTCTALEM